MPKLNAKIPTPLFERIYRVWRKTAANEMRLEQYIVTLLERGAKRR